MNEAKAKGKLRLEGKEYPGQGRRYRAYPLEPLEHPTITRREKMAYSLSRWSLDDLYPGFNSPELESAFDQVEEQIGSFEGLPRTAFPEHGQRSIHGCLARLRGIHAHPAASCMPSPGLAFAADTQDQAAQTLQSRVQQFVAEMQQPHSVLQPVVEGTGRAQDAKRLMDVAGDYRYYLEEMRHFKPHTLSEAGGEDRQPQGCDRLECADHPVRCHHEPLCLQT